MIRKDCFADAYIRKLQQKSQRDPILLERAIYAFGLLEALAQVGLPFIFKGGTCLMLLLEHPRRLSTDIDIIVEPGTDLDRFISEASRIFPFRSEEEQKRRGMNHIEKRHFKFTYDSPVNGKPFYILLDVLFEENQYAELVNKEIRNDLLLTEPEYLTVQIPSADCILADRLTAFAPHTVFCQVKIPGFAKANSLVLPREFPGNCQINSLVLPRYFTRMRALRRR